MCLNGFLKGSCHPKSTRTKSLAVKWFIHHSLDSLKARKVYKLHGINGLALFLARYNSSSFSVCLTPSSPVTRLMAVAEMIIRRLDATTACNLRWQSCSRRSDWILWHAEIAFRPLLDSRCSSASRLLFDVA